MDTLAAVYFCALSAAGVSLKITGASLLAGRCNLFTVQPISGGVFNGWNLRRWDVFVLADCGFNLALFFGCFVFGVECKAQPLSELIAWADSVFAVG